jgi:hypothetical protein
VTIHLTEAGAGVSKLWDTDSGFHGPLPSPPKALARWEELAQVLLMSNEFAFVD